jgi:BlaI family transcriptional regulator, penicillinase repressor
LHNYFLRCIFVLTIPLRGGTTPKGCHLKTHKMKKLTNAEEEVMQILWELGEGFVKDVIDRMPDPKPAYNTVSTVIRVLEKKKFIGHRQYGNTYQYFPVISRDEYASIHFKGFLSGYFNNSFPQMAAFFARENNLSMKELQELMKLTEEEMKKSKKYSDE